MRHLSSRSMWLIELPPDGHAWTRDVRRRPLVTVVRTVGSPPASGGAGRPAPRARTHGRTGSTNRGRCSRGCARPRSSAPGGADSGRSSSAASAARRGTRCPPAAPRAAQACSPPASHAAAAPGRLGVAAAAAMRGPAHVAGALRADHRRPPLALSGRLGLFGQWYGPGHRYSHALVWSGQAATAHPSREPSGQVVARHPAGVRGASVAPQTMHASWWSASRVEASTGNRSANGSAVSAM